MSRRPGLFLDRDGVLNQVVLRDGVVSSPWQPAEFQLSEGVRELGETARRLGFCVVVVTNQPDLTRGNLDSADLMAMHGRLGEELRPDAIEVCGASDNTDPRRKPNPGMILDAAARLGIDLARSLMAGDSGKDLEAARRAGIPFILVRTAHNGHLAEKADFVCNDLAGIEPLLERFLNDELHKRVSG